MAVQVTSSDAVYDSAFTGVEDISPQVQPTSAQLCSRTAVSGQHAAIGVGASRK